MMNSAPSLKAKAAAELELRKRRQQVDSPLTLADLRILDKRQQLIPLSLNRAQADYAANRTGRDLILKARQLGFSTFIQADIFTSAVNGTISAGVLAHDDDTTQKLRRMQQRYYDTLPDNRKPVRSIDNATEARYPTTQSVIHIGTAGSRQKGRGGTYSRIHGSEVAFWPDARAIMAGLMQGVPHGFGRIELESTPNGAQGWFYEQCMAALSGNSDWRLHFYAWWWDDAYRLPAPADMRYTDDEAALVAQHGLTPEQITWRRAKIAELGDLFPQEYPEDPRTCFLTSGNGYFGNIEDKFTAPLYAEPIPGHRYVGGLDFAQSSDYTALVIIDADTYEMVDCLHINRVEWQEIRTRIAHMAHKWNAPVMGENNSMGYTNIELLQSGEYSATGERLYEGVELYAFNTNERTKPMIIQGLKHGLHNGGLRLQPLPAMQHEMRSYISRQQANGKWVYEAGSGAHDDLVMATALAWYHVAKG